MTDSCGTCRFFMTEARICRRYPPTLILVTTPEPPKPPAIMPTLSHELRSYFPEMDAAKGWCGCWERAGLVN